MEILGKRILIALLLFLALECNPIQEMREARDAAERANKEAEMVLENMKGYAERVEASAKKAEEAAKKSEAIFEKKLKK